MLSSFPELNFPVVGADRVKTRKLAHCCVSDKVDVHPLKIINFSLCTHIIGLNQKVYRVNLSYF
jgi:hypothetical protein